MAEPRNCPKCATLMTYRLGEYECPQCGHFEAQAAETPKQSESSGPGFKQPWQHPGTAQGARPGAVVPPPPTPGTMFQPGQSIPGYSSYDSADSSGRALDTLEKEKQLYFYIVAGFEVLSLVILLVGAAMAGAGAFIAELFGGLIGVAIRLGVLYWILFEGILWIKKACLGCNVIGMIILVLAGFFGGAAVGNALYGTADADMAGFVGLVWWIYIFLSLAWAGWFVSILYRDIQQMEGRG